MNERRRQRIAWISFFPVEWLDNVPAEVACLPREHPATWQRSLLAQLEKRDDYEIHVVVLKKHFARSLDFVRNGVHFHLIKTMGGLRAPSLFWLDTLLIRKRLAGLKPDLVHAWGNERGAALVASRLGFPAIATVQGLMRWMNGLVPPNRYQRLLAWLEHQALQRSQVATAESNFSTNYLRREYPHLTVHHVDLAPDPLFSSIVRTPLTNPPRFVFTGELGPAKGGDLLLVALDALVSRFNFQLVVIGAMRETFRQEMAQRISPEVWRRISFRSNLQPPEVAEELAKACLFICPTRADTGPLAVKEAAVSGVPIVASAIGGTPDYVCPDQNGLLSTSGDANSLRDTIAAALTHPLFSQGQVVGETLSRKRAELDANLMSNRFTAVYEAALKSRRDHLG